MSTDIHILEYQGLIMLGLLLSSNTKVHGSITMHCELYAMVLRLVLMMGFKC